MFPELSAFLSGLNHAVNIAKATRGASEQSAVLEVLLPLQIQTIELVGKIKSLEEQILSLKKKNDDLVAEIERLVSWPHEESANYVLKKLGPGVFARIDKDHRGPIEDVPWYCDHCYGRAKKSMFVLCRYEGERSVHRCSECSREIVIGGPAARSSSAW